MGSLCEREKVRPERFFPRSEKKQTNKQTNKCSKAGRDITRTWWTLIFSKHGPYFHTRVLGESEKRQSAKTFTRHGRNRSVLYHISNTYNTRAIMVVMMAVMMVMTLLSATFFILLFTVDRRSAKIQPQRKSLLVHTKQEHKQSFTIRERRFADKIA